MNLVLDTHTHTLASHHAYSTVLEMAQYAALHKLELLAITDHTPALPDSSHWLHFANYGVLDRELFGVEMLYGAELNIVSFEGEVDLPPELLRRMDYCIASYHTECLAAGSLAQNTQAMLRVMENPYVSILGHPNDSNIPVDYDALARGARDCGVLLEVNNATLRPTTHRKGTREMLIKMLESCVKYSVPVSLGTDAHFATAVGRFDQAQALLAEIGFPEELVVNTSVEKFKAHLKKQ